MTLTARRKPETPDIEGEPTPAQVAEWLRLFTAPDGCVELRALGVTRHSSEAPHAESAFYDPANPKSLNALARDARDLAKRSRGVYFTLNPVNAALYHANPNGRATLDADILARRWLIIDIDSKRTSSGESNASDLEKEHALKRAKEIRSYLNGEAWPSPMLADSGNGYHLLYRVELANDDDARSLLRRCLRALDAKFTDGFAAVDTNCFNASRMGKVYGTLTRKGAHTDDRPQRYSRIVEAPKPTIVGIEWLDALAAQYKDPRTAGKPQDPRTSEKLDDRGTSEKIKPRRLTAKRSKHRATILDRARAYLDGCPPAVSGDKGHPQTFKIACSVGPGFNLHPSDALALLTKHYNPRCEPPWTDDELRHKIDEAYKTETRRGWKLDDDDAVDDDAPPPPADRNGKPATARAKESLDDPHRLARRFLKTQATHADGPCLRYWLERWHRWNGNAWRLIPEPELAALITRTVKAEFDRYALTRGKKLRHVTPSATSAAIAALKSVVLLDSEQIPAMPAWITTEGPTPNPLECVAAKNGIVHLASLVANAAHLTPPTPRYFCANALDFAFDLTAPEPTHWLKFLASLWPDDAESIAALQEWFGYLLTPDTRQQKMLMLVGPRRSGKGTIGRVLQARIGPANVAAPTLSSLANNFVAQPLIGKSVAIIPDARLSGRADATAIIERLLSISGQDAQTIDRKYREDWTGYLSARFVVFTNELPRLTDASGALPGRIVLLKLTHSFYGNEDTELTDRLLTELPAILLWSIAGWHRLKMSKHFTQPRSALDLLTDLGALSSPISAFVEEQCVVDPKHDIAIADLYSAYRTWCSDNGRDRPGDAQSFGRNLKALLPDLSSHQTRDSGKPRRAYYGITLREREGAF